MIRPTTIVRPRPGNRVRGWIEIGRRQVLGVVLVGVLVGTGSLAHAEELAGNHDNQVKAAFLVKFASFIEWPAAAFPDTNAPFRIGLLGREPFGSEFDASVQRERVKDRPVELRRANQPEALADCQIVYVAAAEREQLAEIITAFAGRPVLLVTDAEGATERGSHINFVKTGGRLRFEINLAATERAGLKVGAKLQQVGIIVEPSSPSRGRTP